MAIQMIGTLNSNIFKTRVNNFIDISSESYDFNPPFRNSKEYHGLTTERNMWGSHWDVKLRQNLDVPINLGSIQ